MNATRIEDRRDREKRIVGQMMRWSGPRMIFYHPMMAVQHVLQMKKEKKLLQQ